MQKQTHKQSASTSSGRFYIDVAGELVKHAQKMRKQSHQEPQVGSEAWNLATQESLEAMPFEQRVDTIERIQKSHDDFMRVRNEAHRKLDRESPGWDADKTPDERAEELRLLRAAAPPILPVKQAAITDELKELETAHRMGVNPDILTESFIGRHPYLSTTLGLVGAGGLAGGLGALGGIAGTPVGALVGAAKTDKENTGAIPRGALHGGLRGAGLAGGATLGGILGGTGAAQLSSSLGGGWGTNAALGGLGAGLGVLGGGYLGQRAGGGAARALVGDIKQEDEEKEASWFYQTGPEHLKLTGNEQRYNKNLATILGAGGVGLGIGGLAALTQMLRRPGVQDMARPQHSANLPIELVVPQRTKRLRRKPEEEEGEEELAKAASGVGDTLRGWGRALAAPFQSSPIPSHQVHPPLVPAPPGSVAPAPGPDVGMLGDEAWQHTVTYPGAGLALGGGFLAANAIGDYLAKRRRKKLREQAVRNAKDDYEAAITEQFVSSDVKAAAASSELSVELDSLHEDYVKLATGFDGGFKVSVPDILGGAKLPTGQQVKNVAGMAGGGLAALALITGIPAAVLTYEYARKKHKRHQPLSEAMRRRKAELARRRPAPIYLTPGEEIVHEEDEPAIESV